MRVSVFGSRPPAKDGRPTGQGRNKPLKAFSLGSKSALAFRMNLERWFVYAKPSSRTERRTDDITSKTFRLPLHITKKFSVAPLMGCECNEPVTGVYAGTTGSFDRTLHVHNVKALMHNLTPTQATQPGKPRTTCRTTPTHPPPHHKKFSNPIAEPEHPIVKSSPLQVPSTPLPPATNVGQTNDRGQAQPPGTDVNDTKNV